MRMGGIMIYENVQVFLLVRLTVNRLEECEKLLMGLFLITCPSHAASGHLECGQQGTGSVSCIIMGDGAPAAFLEGQTRLGAISRLDGCLLINAKDHGIVGWVQI